MADLRSQRLSLCLGGLPRVEFDLGSRCGEISMRLLRRRRSEVKASGSGAKLSDHKDTKTARLSTLSADIVLNSQRKYRSSQCFIMSDAPTAQWSWYNFWICFLVSLGMLAFAYPASIIATTLAQPSFLIDMGLLDVTQDPPALVPNANAFIGAISGVSSQENRRALLLTSPRYSKQVVLSIPLSQAG